MIEKMNQGERCRNQMRSDLISECRSICSCFFAFRVNEETCFCDSCNQLTNSLTNNISSDESADEDEVMHSIWRHHVFTLISLRSSTPWQITHNSPYKSTQCQILSQGSKAWLWPSGCLGWTCVIRPLACSLTTGSKNTTVFRHSWNVG